MKYTGFIALIFLLYIFAPISTYGCSCSPPPQIEEFKKAGSVIIARFIKSTGNVAKFKVVKSWKGVKANKIIYLNVFILDCGLKIDLVKGNKFLLYVPTRDEKSLDENPYPRLWFVCGNSDSIEGAREDIKNMDKIAAESKNQ